jgi:hypothetical protein
MHRINVKSGCGAIALDQHALHPGAQAEFRLGCGLRRRRLRADFENWACFHRYFL